MQLVKFCRPYATRESLLASPPGVTAAVHSKFQHNLTATIPDATAMGMSLNAKAGAETAHAVAQLHATRQLTASDSDASKSRSAANSVSQSLYGAEMANFYTEGALLRACTEEELQVAFSLAAEASTSASGTLVTSLPFSATRRILSAALHREPTRRQAEALEAALVVRCRAWTV